MRRLYSIFNKNTKKIKLINLSLNEVLFFIKFINNIIFIYYNYNYNNIYINIYLMK